MNISKSICLWILDFLTCRPQFVFINHNGKILKSSTPVINTGVSQGIVLAPTLFTIYIDSCRGSFANIPIIKYADGTSIHGLIKTDEDVEISLLLLTTFVNWCDRHFLKFNVKNKKEFIFDFRPMNMM